MLATSALLALAAVALLVPRSRTALERRRLPRESKFELEGAPSDAVGCRGFLDAEEHNLSIRRPLPLFRPSGKANVLPGPGKNVLIRWMRSDRLRIDARVAEGCSVVLDLEFDPWGEPRLRGRYSLQSPSNQEVASGTVHFLPQETR